MALGHGPKVVTDGLVLALDAADVSSYPGSGTTWTDLSGNGNNGTLVNGVGYDGSNGGYLSFDGVNDYVRCTPKNSTTNGLYFGGTTSISVSAWVKNNITNTFNNFVMYEDVVNGNSVEPVRLATTVGQAAFFSIAKSNISYSAISNTILNDTDYYHLTGTFGGGYVKIYVNGIFESQVSLSGSMDVPFNGTSARWIIGSGELNSSRFLNGNIAQVSIYNRALTTSEISQNYNATKSRFQ